MFINRKSELTHLENLYNSSRAEFYILYGRRRVGKTELLRAFSKNKKNIFFIATLSSDNEQLEKFSQAIYAYSHETVPQGFTFPSWEDAIISIADLPMTERPIIIIDEFTYLISGNHSIPSIIQKVWDSKLQYANIMLILCGSYIGMMENEVLRYQAPLYGRRTSSVFLSPLNFPSSALFHRNYSPDLHLLTWAILGGMPYYLNTFSDQKDISSNILEQILDPLTAPLYNEPRLLLMEELREPRNYFSILRAIAQGKTRLSEITQSSGVGTITTVNKYLDVLQQLHLIKRYSPITEKNPTKSKKGIYQINDHFLRFWFRYVFPHQSSIELGLSNSILQNKILPDLNHFAAVPFEKAAQQHTAFMARHKDFPFLPQRIGKWWNRQTEIDVVAINDDEHSAFVGECKWSIHPVGMDIYNELIQKSIVLRNETKIDSFYFGLFSRSGFTENMIQYANENNIQLVTIDDMTDQQSN